MPRTQERKRGHAADGLRMHLLLISEAWQQFNRLLSLLLNHLVGLKPDLQIIQTTLCFLPYLAAALCGYAEILFGLTTVAAR